MVPLGPQRAALDETIRNSPDRIGLALVLRSFSEGGSEAALHGADRIAPENMPLYNLG
jgi:hypothetical protein